MSAATLKWVKQNIKIPGGENVDSGPQKSGVNLVSTDGFGEVHFIGATRKSRAQFARIGNTTSAETAYEMMTQHWEMEQPRLVISVTGGAKSFNLEPRLKKQFASGLLKVAETPGAWVITGGTNTGVMKHVGEALKGATKACIGIATWGIVTNLKALISDESANGKQDRTFGGNFPYHVASSLIEQGAFLDHNHTHFLLVDDGTTRKYGRELAFRASLDKLLVDRQVPSVLLVLEGGPGTLGTIKGSLEGQVPVVLIKDSGRAADFLVDVLENFSQEELDSICAARTGNEKLMGLVEETFPGNPSKSEEENNKTLRELYNCVVICLQNRKLITVFQMDSSSSVDEAILTALLSTKSADSGNDSSDDEAKRHARQLHFTLLWDRPDLAEDKILSQNLRWKAEDLRNAMITALAMNRVQFVKLFLEYGISLVKNVDKNTLQFLYGYCMHSPTSILMHAISVRLIGAVCPTNPEETTTSLGKSVEEMLCEDTGIDINKCAVDIRDIHKAVDNLCSGIRQSNTLLTEMPIEKCPFRELFLWAVLNGMHEMAMELWAFEEEGLMKALIAAEINKQLAEKAAGISNLADDVQKAFSDYALEFQNLALDLLEECYKKDEKTALKLITGKSEQFNDLTCLDVAVKSGQLQFVSHSAVQSLLNDVWTGSIKNVDISTAEFLLSVVFPPYLYSFDFRTESEMKDMITTEEQPATTLAPALPILGMQHGGIQMSDLERKEENAENRGSKTILVADRRKNYQTISEDPDGNTSNQDSNINNTSEMPFYKKFLLFYFKTPCVKFYTTLVAYIIFLLLIAYVAMEEKRKSPSIQEYIVIAFVVSFTLEEVNQFVRSEYQSFGAKLRDYLSSKWNLVDILANVLFYVALGLRLNPSTEQYGYMLYSFDAAIWILRLLHVFYAHRIMGPYVVMIYRMFVDMLYFLSILVVFLFAYGVCSSAIMVQRKTVVEMIRDVLFRPYFNIYGELFIDRDPESSDVTRFGYPVLNNYGETLGWFLLGGYLLIANVLLLNLLIAVFGNTFTEVQDNASQIWKFQRYDLILEYANRPPLVPPFIILAHIYTFCKWLIKLCSCSKDQSQPTGGLKSILSDKERERVDEFESDCLSSFLRSRAVAEEIEEGNISDVLEKMRGLQKCLTTMEERMKAIESNPQQ